MLQTGDLHYQLHMRKMPDSGQRRNVDTSPCIPACTPAISPHAEIIPAIASWHVLQLNLQGSSHNHLLTTSVFFAGQRLRHYGDTFTLVKAQEV